MTTAGWSEDQWHAFCALLERGFKAAAPFDRDDEAAYRLLLADISPGDAHAALRRLVASGQVFRPAPGEIVAAARGAVEDARPTFAEACALIFGPGGVTSVRARGAFATESMQNDAQRAAVNERLGELHPLIASFVVAQGLDRLRGLRVDDPVDGGKVRGALRHEWIEHVEAQRGRVVTALTVGSRDGLRRVDAVASFTLAERAS